MKTVLVPLAEGFEDMEAVTMVDILRRGGIEVTTAGLTEGLVTGARGMVVQPDTVLDEVLEHSFDMVALPGGQPGTANLKADARIIELLKRTSDRDKAVAAICAAPTVLGEAGLLNGREATAYPNTLDAAPPEGVTLSEEAVVEDGLVTTSRGPGTAIDFALALVQQLEGKEIRDSVEAALQR